MQEPHGRSQTTQTRQQQISWSRDNAVDFTRQTRRCGVVAYTVPYHISSCPSVSVWALEWVLCQSALLTGGNQDSDGQLTFFAARPSCVFDPEHVDADSISFKLAEGSAYPSPITV